MTDAHLARFIDEAAVAAELDPAFVRAIVAVESAGNPYAWRPEPRYRFLWDVRTHRPFRTLTDDELSRAAAPADFSARAGSRDQEWTAQRASWGLMQIMGAVAREHGFDGLYLTVLTDPEVNLRIGCAYLRLLLRWADGDHGKAAGAYNAGKGGWRSIAGQAYAAKVMAAWAERMNP